LSDSGLALLVCWKSIGVEIGQWFLPTAMSTKTFFDYMGIKHRLITPCWLQANGMVEKFMQSIGKIKRSAIVEKKDIRAEINCFLRNYRYTPPSATKFATPHLQWNRGGTSRLPSWPQAA